MTNLVLATCLAVSFPLETNWMPVAISPSETRIAEIVFKT